MTNQDIGSIMVIALAMVVAVLIVMFVVKTRELSLYRKAIRQLRDEVESMKEKTELEKNGIYKKNPKEDDTVIVASGVFDVFVKHNDVGISIDIYENNKLIEELQYWDI